MDDEPIVLKRDITAVQIPSGARMALAKGTTVRITQSLGGNFTVLNDDGYMAQIAGRDADALGKDVPPEARADTQTSVPVEGQVWTALKTCYDPEIPVNIVDLGLIYDCKIIPQSEGGQRVSVKMTLTAPGCGMGPMLATEVQHKLLNIPGVREADVELVWDPPWDRSKLSEAAKLQLGLM